MKQQPSPRMYGITPTPFEMPPGLIPESKAKSQQPIFVSLICGYLVIRGVVNLLLALVPWGNPESSMATFLSAHPDIIFSLLPRVVRSALAAGANCLFIESHPCPKEAKSDAASVMFTAGYTDRIPTSLMQPTASLPLAVFFQLGTPYPKVQQRGYASALILTIIVLIISISSRWISARLNKYTVK